MFGFGWDRRRFAPQDLLSEKIEFQAVLLSAANTPKSFNNCLSETMEGITKQRRVYRHAQPNSSGVRIEMNQSDNETTYWGVLCRTCSEPVAFDSCPYPSSFGPGAQNVKPGAVRCRHGHNHVYFPRDFRFFSSAVPISDAVVQENRDAYRAINPSSQISFSDDSCPAEKTEAFRREVEIFGDGDDLPSDEWTIVWESNLCHEKMMVKLNALRSEKRSNR
jgi:hypothetical protein